MIIYYAKFSHTPKMENPVVTPRNQLRFIGVRKPGSGPDKAFLLLFLLFFVLFCFYSHQLSYCLSMGRCLYTIIWNPIALVIFKDVGVAPVIFSNGGPIACRGDPYWYWPMETIALVISKGVQTPGLSLEPLISLLTLHAEYFS